MIWPRFRVFVRHALFAVPVGAIIVDRVGSAATVEGVSMQPLLNPGSNVDVVLINRMATSDYRQIKRGDVITLISPKNPRERLVKRVIALQGDSVQPRKSSSVVRVPTGHYWIEGDNHNCSLDSNHFGPVPIGLMTGRVTHIIWPPSRFSAVESRLPPERKLRRKHLYLQSQEESPSYGIQHDLDEAEAPLLA